MNVNAVYHFLTFRSPRKRGLGAGCLCMPVGAGFSPPPHRSRAAGVLSGMGDGRGARIGHEGVPYLRAMRYFIATALLIATASAAPKPPGHPASGPGGSDYAHGSMRVSEHGKDGTQYWIFEPQEPQPATAPLVLFFHGYSAMTPEPYEGWIEHIVRRGAVVVYPRYQAELLTPPTEYHANSAASVRDALGVLEKKGRVAPDLTRVAAVGHSAGGVGAATWAARALAEKLPQPKAVMAVHAGQGPENGIQLVPLDDYSTIPAGTQLVVMASAEDGFVGLGTSQRIWSRTGQVRERAFITLAADKHGSPALRPGHLAPLAAGRLSTDALDWLGYWRVFDALCASAFAGQKMDINPAMGKWSDGTDVAPLTIAR